MHSAHGFGALRRRRVVGRKSEWFGCSARGHHQRSSGKRPICTDWASWRVTKPGALVQILVRSNPSLSKRGWLALATHRECDYHDIRGSHEHFGWHPTSERLAAANVEGGSLPITRVGV